MHQTVFTYGDLGMPNGIAAVGYRKADVPELVEGAMQQQQRLLAMAPVDLASDDVAAVFERSLELW